MNYSLKTQALIDRQCRNVERKSFRLNKKKAEECLIKTYDLFELKHPSKIVWCSDPFTKKFQENAGNAWNAGNARNAWNAWNAGNAWNARNAGNAWNAWNAGSARNAWSAWSAGSARNAWSAWSAGSARSAWSARNARSAWSAGSAGNARSAWNAGNARSAWNAGSAGSAWNAEWSALDYDFDWYIFEFEYCQNPDKGLEPNENDYKYLEYCELLMQAKEAGCGYRIEWEDTLYLVPTPLVKIDERNRFHSLYKPAIKWKNGLEFYYLWGINFDKKLWEKVVAEKLSFKEIMGLSNIEQRMAAIKVYGSEKLLENTNAELVDSIKGYDLYRVKDVFRITAYYLKYADPSTGRIYVSGIDPQVGVKKDAVKALAWKFYLEEGETFTQQS